MDVAAAFFPERMPAVQPLRSLTDQTEQTSF
jgi:hypothetical protein